MAGSKANSNLRSANTTQTNNKPRVLSARELQRRTAQNIQRPPGASDPSTYISESATPANRPSRFSSFINRFRQRYAALPAPIRGTARTLRYIAPALSIGIFFTEHVLQVMWVRGPSMTPYLNENYAEMQTESDMVLVNMLPLGSGWLWGPTKTLERGMVVTFR
jgi:inner membrane protease subunit 2